MKHINTTDTPVQITVKFEFVTQIYEVIVNHYHSITFKYVNIHVDKP